MAHIIDEKEQPMSNFGTAQGPNKRYRRLRHPAFTADTWTDANPLLQKGEIGIETDTYKMKAGDGVTYWNDLPYTFDDVGANIDLSNLSATGKANVSAQGTYDSSATYSAGTVGNALQGKLNLDGTNTMTGVLKMRASVSFQCAIAPYWDGVGFYKLNDNDSVTLMASMESTQGFSPFSTNTYDIGTSSHKWKDLYLAGKVYVATINNGGDIAVPTKAGTMALESDIGRTNCITEIPQDIQLELSDGTLTLKAGSKVYFPDGAGTFTATTIPNDVVFLQNSSVGSNFLFLNTSLQLTRHTTTASGTSIPSGFTGIFYNTSTNHIYYCSNGSGTDVTANTFPLAKITIATDQTATVSSIDQVFNGFGYIGTSVYVLPGVKALVPEGRNADGTLKSSQSTISSVKVHTFNNGNHCVMLAKNGNIVVGNNFYYDVSLSTLSSSDCAYLSDRNEVWRYGSGGLYMPYSALAFTIYVESGMIKTFAPKFVFHAVDYSDGDYIANCAMPSDRYVDLILGTSPFNVTAPADGYIVLAKNSTATGQELRLKNQSNLLEVHCAAGKNNQDLAVTIPCSKGQVVRVYFSADGTTSAFRFVYANGAK